MHGTKHVDKCHLTHSTRVTNETTDSRHDDFHKNFFFFDLTNDFHNGNVCCSFIHSTNFRVDVVTNDWLNDFFN